MNAHLGLDLEAGRQHREAFDEPARKRPVAGEDIAETAPKEPGEEPGEQLVSKHVAAAIGMFRLVPAGTDHHVELLGE